MFEFEFEEASMASSRSILPASILDDSATSSGLQIIASATNISEDCASSTSSGLQILLQIVQDKIYQYCLQTSLTVPLLLQVVCKLLQVSNHPKELEVSCVAKLYQLSYSKVICMSIWSVFLSVSVCMVRLSVSLSVCMVCLPVSLSVCLSVCLYP